MRMHVASTRKAKPCPHVYRTMSELSSLGPIAWGVIVIGIALLLVFGVFQVILVLPARFINHLADKSPMDDFGGKVIALSFALGPVCAGVALMFLEKQDFLLAMVIGWVAAIAILMRLVDAKPKP